VRRHRFSRGGLSHDETRLSGRLRAFSQLPLPGPHVTAESASAGAAVDASPVRGALVSGAIWRRPAADRGGSASALSGGVVSPLYAAHGAGVGATNRG